MAESAVVAAGVTAVLLLKWRDLLLYAFDPLQARAMGLPVRVLHYGLLCILSLTVVGALKATRIILTIALLIALGATAFLLSDRFGRMLALATALAVAAAFGGVWLSFHLDSAPAPTISLLLSLASIATFAARTLRGRVPAEAGDPRLSRTART